MRARYAKAAAVEVTGGSRFGIAAARGKRIAVCGDTFAIHKNCRPGGERANHRVF